MSKANCYNSTADTSRRRFLAFTAAASAVSAGSLAIAAMPPAALQASSLDDSALLNLEEQIFEQYEAATAYDDEIFRLAKICRDESRRRYDRALDNEKRTGIYQSAEDRWKLSNDMPEREEHDRLCDLQTRIFGRIDDLVKEMFAMPARTPEGRRAKVLVALRLLPEQWRDTDDNADWGILETRRLLFEFVGGEPGAQLKDQFS